MNDTAPAATAPTPPTGAEDCRERYEERAAIQQHDGGLTQAAAEVAAAEARREAMR